MYSYKELERILSDKGIKKSEMGTILGISSRTIAKISKGEKISSIVLKKIADFLQCQPSDLFKIELENKLLQTLRDEKEAKISGGIYHELQVRMTYNSNHIEGSKLDEDQTRLIFETNTVDTTGGVPVDDIIETVNHFRAIDFVIDSAEDSLSEYSIKELHRILKQNTKDSALNWFAVGDYKKRANVVGGKETAKPSEVAEKMRDLIFHYENNAQIVFEDIIRFHAEFEKIHPFQDGNGRVGRLIALKECLRHNIVPFIILDERKNFYYRGLSEWDEQPGFLLGTCEEGQDIYKKLLDYFDIPYKE